MSPAAAVTAQVAHDTPASPDDVAAHTSEDVFARLIARLHQAGVALWVIDGFGDGVFDPIDIDILVPRTALPNKIAKTIHDSRQQIGASLISWDRDNQFVLVGDPQVPA